MKSLKIMKMMFAISILNIFIACGGSSLSSTTTIPTGTGTYVDSAIEGVDYVCGNSKGKTNSDGEFTFDKGTGCSFSLAGILLRTIDSTSLGDGAFVVEDNPKVAKLLQSIDANGNVEDGIEINDEVLASLTTALNEHGSVGQVPEGSVLTNIVSDIGKNVNGISGVVRTDDEVLNHINDTKKQRIKSLFSNNIFYKVKNVGLGSLEYLTEIIVNREVTRFTTTLLSGPNIGESKNLNVVVNERGLVINGTLYYFTNVETDYISLHRFGGNLVNEGVDYYFFTREKAEEYLSKNNLIIVPTNTNRAPIVNAGTNKSVTVNQSITITGSATDSDGTIVSYEWKKGSDILATTASFEYIPTVVGSDNLTLTVTDDDGSSVSDTVVITVEAENDLNSNKIDLVKYLYSKEPITNQYTSYTLNGYDSDGVADETIFTYSSEDSGQEFYDVGTDIINGISEYKRFVEVGEIFYSTESIVSGHTSKSTSQLVEKLTNFEHRGNLYSGDILKVKVTVEISDVSSTAYVYYKKDRGLIVSINVTNNSSYYLEN